VLVAVLVSGSPPEDGDPLPRQPFFWILAVISFWAAAMRA
jgi:hypothetical protein